MPDRSERTENAAAARATLDAYSRTGLREQWIVTVPDGRSIDVLALIGALRYIVDQVDRGNHDAMGMAYHAKMALRNQNLLPPDRL